MRIMDKTRRMLLGRSAGLFAAGGALLLPLPVAAAARHKAFDARKAHEVLAQAGLADARPSPKVHLQAPQLADNAALVPIEMASELPGTRALALVIDRNPFPYIARFDFMPGAVPFARLRVRIAESSRLRAAALTADGWHETSGHVDAAAGGCAADAAHAPAYPDPPPSIRMRARSLDQGIEVLALLTHPNENGLRKDSSGAPIPERFIVKVSLRRNGQPLVLAQLGRSVSQDPLLALRLLEGRKGDRLALGWEDSAGATRADEIALP